MPFDQLVTQITANYLAIPLASMIVGAYLASRRLPFRKLAPVVAMVR